MQECPPRTVWHELLEDRLDPAAVEPLRSHLAGCERCRAEIDSAAEPGGARVWQVKPARLNDIQLSPSLLNRLRLVGWKEPGPDGKPKFQAGFLTKNEMSREDAELFILKARVVAGWVEPQALEDALAARAAALDAEEAELNAAGESEGTAVSRAEDLFKRSPDAAGSSEQS